MKSMKKLVVGAMCALVVALGANATLAWLTDTDEVTNTFTVGNIDISLYEHEYNPETNELTDKGVWHNNNYKMVPGVVMPKDPTLVVKEGSEDCWLFVQVKETCGVDGYTFDDFISYDIDENNWKSLQGVGDVYYCKATDITSDRNIKVLADEQVTVKDAVTKEMMDALQEAYDTKGEEVLPNLTFTAYAVQLAGSDTPQEAWRKILAEDEQ